MSRRKAWLFDCPPTLLHVMRASTIFTALAAAVCSVSAASVEKRQSLARVVTSCVKPNTAALTFVC